jgi:hypothetical protein
MLVKKLHTTKAINQLRVFQNSYLLLLNKESTKIRLDAPANLGAKSYPKPLAKRVEFIAVDVGLY